MSDPVSNFAALSLILTPAVLTNASSILILSPSNGLAPGGGSGAQVTLF